jgi:hypothetical protein
MRVSKKNKEPKDQTIAVRRQPPPRDPGADRAEPRAGAEVVAPAAQVRGAEPDAARRDLAAEREHHGQGKERPERERVAEPELGVVRELGGGELEPVL